MEGFYKGSKRDLLKGSVRVKGIYGGFCKSQKGCTREAEGFRKASTRIKKVPDVGINTGSFTGRSGSWFCKGSTRVL